MFNTSWRCNRASREPTGQVIRSGAWVLSLTLAIVSSNAVVVNSSPILGAECETQADSNDDGVTFEPASALQESNGQFVGDAVSGPPPELPALTDLHGDPLPAGAMVRLGTVRFRGPTRNAAFAEDGKLLVSGSGQRTCSWEVTTGKKVHDARVEGGPGNSVISLAANLCASVDGSQIFLCDLSTGKRLRAWSLSMPPEICHLAFSANGKLLAGGTSYYDVGLPRTRLHGAVHVWSTATGREVARLEGQKQVVDAVAFSPDGRQLATGDRRGTVRVWEVLKGRLLSEFPAFDSLILKIEYTSDGKHLVATDAVTTKVLEPASGEAVREFDGGCFALSRYSDLLALGVEGGTLDLLHADTGREICSIRGPGNPGVPLAIAPDSKTLATGLDGAIRLWDVETGKERAECPGHFTRPFRGLFSPDGKLVATSTNTGDGTVRVWESATGRQVHQLEAHVYAARKRGWSPDVVSLAFSPDGKLLASAGIADGVRLWNVDSGHELLFLEPTGDPENEWLGAVAFSPDGQRVAAAGRIEAVHEWEVATGRLIRRFLPEDHDSSEFTTCLQFSPDGSILAAGGSRHIILWDAASGKELRRMEFGTGAGHRVLVWRIEFSPDGRFLASSGQTGQLHVWQVATSKPLYVSPSRPQRSLCYTSLDYSSDGRLIAHCSRPGPSQAGITRLIKAATGEVLHELPGTTHPIAFSPDGKRLLNGKRSTDLLIWDLTQTSLFQQ